jgi:DNA uptake protein ComE-like DNA-binding protein
LARDLRIGRPDIPHDYDDGGLVDVNSMSARDLVRWLSITPDDAERIAAARATVGRFSSIEELGMLAGIDGYHVDLLCEYLIFL